jgi:hypothetical protein
MESSIEINEEENSRQKMKEGIDSCDEHEDQEHKHEMKGPSLFNNNDFSKNFNLNPDMIEKIQKNPKFMEMMKKQEEENKIKNMEPREKLRARLLQKQNNRMSIRTKEALQDTENETKQKRTKKTKKPPINKVV